MNGLIELLSRWGNLWTEAAAPMLWQSTVLIAVVFALDLVLRKRVRATVRYGIWMLILIKLLLPASLSFPTSIGYWVPPPQAISEDPVFQVHLPLTTPAFVGKSTEVATVAIPSPTLQWQSVAVLLWLVGIVILTLVVVFQSAAARRIVADAEITNEFSETLERCRRMLGLHRCVSLRLSKAVATPAVCGQWRPVILLPQALAGKLEPSQMETVLMHELAHVKRGDLWVGFVQTVLQVFYFYNPLLWLANAAIRRVREEAVDEMTLVALARDADLYPEALLKVARLSQPTAILAFGFAGILERKSTLAARIRLMAQRPWPTSAKIGVPGALAVLILAMLLLPMSYSRKTPSYGGKTAQQWFAQIDLSQDQGEKKFAEGVYAFKQMGAQGVPFLREVLTRAPSTKRGHRIKDPQADAAFVLEKMGALAAPAVPELSRLLSGDDPKAANWAAGALGAIGGQARGAVPVLLTALRAGNGFAGSALVEIDPENPTLVPALIEEASNPTRNNDSHVEAAVALMKLGPPAKAAVPGLLQMLKQTNNSVIATDSRVFGAWALQRTASGESNLTAEISGVLQPPPEPLPDIDQLIEDSKKAAIAGDKGRSLGVALEKLGMAVSDMQFRGLPVPENEIRERILPLFEKALDVSNPHDLRNAFCGLIALHRAGAPLLPRVIAFLATNDSIARNNACIALTSIAPGDMTTLPTLIRLLDDVRDGVKQNAAAGLVHFGSEARGAIPSLRRCLKENSLYVQFNAALALWHIAKEPPSVALLKRAISEDDGGDFVPLRTLEMLRGMTAQTDKTKEIIRHLAKSYNPEVRTNALALFARLNSVTQ
jgi:beta-lactamase regulating signal transducer with metallopeptidase domain/HEAT repeat protein